MPKKYEKTEVRRRQIAEAALDVIAEFGLGRFTAKAVAARVGIADGSIFRHFENKQEIVLAAMDCVEESLFAWTDADAADPWVRLEAFFRHRARMIGGGSPVGRLVFSDQLAQAAGAQGEERVRSWQRRSREFLLECLIELEDRGRLKHGLEPEEIAPIIQGRLLSFMLDRMLSDKEALNLEDRISKAWAALSRLLFTWPGADSQAGSQPPPPQCLSE